MEADSPMRMGTSDAGYNNVTLASQSQSTRREYPKRKPKGESVVDLFFSEELAKASTKPPRSSTSKPRPTEAASRTQCKDSECAAQRKERSLKGLAARDHQPPNLTLCVTDSESRSEQSPVAASSVLSSTPTQSAAGALSPSSSSKSRGREPPWQHSPPISVTSSLSRSSSASAIKEPGADSKDDMDCMNFRRTRSVPTSAEVIWERDSEESPIRAPSEVSRASDRDNDDDGSSSNRGSSGMKRSSTVGSGMSELTELTKHRQREEEVKVSALSEMQAWKLLGQRRKEALQNGAGPASPLR